MKNFKRLIFNRVVLTGLLVLFQLGFIVLELQKLGSFYLYLSVLLKCISILVTFYLIYKPTNPEIKIAWIVPVLLLPLFGGAFFLLFGHVFIPVGLRAKLEKVRKIKIKGHYWQKDILAEIEKKEMSIANQCRYIEHYSGAPVYKNTKATYFKSGEDYFEKLIKALRSAEKYIFIEFFIIKQGEMWEQVHQVLREKVSAGVEVRVMYDDVGSGFDLPNGYADTLEREGIKSVAFNKLFPLMALILNNRDHRKIVVIDGKIAFTGGINIADEYINKKELFGHWKDNGVMIEGEAVWSFTVMFLQMWNAMREEDQNYLDYKEPMEKAVYEDGFCQPYGSAPLEAERIGETIYLNMLGAAKKYIYIYTPYFIVDHDMLSCLMRAAKRGVDVRMVTPGIPDKRKVYWLTQASYEQLLTAGVKVMQYTPGFMHAKCVLCDDEIAVIGSVNFDYRSFYHHFECGVLLYQSQACTELKKDMEETFAKCEKVDHKWCQTHVKGHPVLGLMLKLFSPLL